MCSLLKVQIQLRRRMNTLNLKGGGYYAIKMILNREYYLYGTFRDVEYPPSPKNLDTVIALR
ncbi:Uncharacterised protein [Alistipes sp. cv1]|nr:Uncharacterised protein [Faecalibacterium prausnitzii]